MKKAHIPVYLDYHTAIALFGPKPLWQHDYKQVYLLKKGKLSCRAVDMRISRPPQIIPPEIPSSSLLSPPPRQPRLAGHNHPLALAKLPLARSLSRMRTQLPQTALLTRHAWRPMAVHIPCRPHSTLLPTSFRSRRPRGLILLLALRLLHGLTWTGRPSRNTKP